MVVIGNIGRFISSGYWDERFNTSRNYESQLICLNCGMIRANHSYSVDSKSFYCGWSGIGFISNMRCKMSDEHFINYYFRYYQNKMEKL